MYVEYNANPQKKRVGDCVIRAISKATGMSWEKTYTEICLQGFRMCDMPSSNSVWGEYLRENGVKDDHIISLNLESPEFNFKDYMELYNYVNDKIIDNDMYYVFLDEVQVVDKFEKAVDGLYI